MLKHIATKKCHEARLLQLQGQIHIVGEPEAEGQLHQYWERLPAFGEDGDDKRIDHLFARPELVEELFSLQLPHIPSWLFVNLWSTNATDRLLHSICSHGCRSRKTFTEVEALDPDTGHNTVLVRHLSKRYAKSMASYLLDFMQTVCEYSVPLRRPDLTQKARQILNGIRQCMATEVGLREIFDSVYDTMFTKL